MFGEFEFTTKADKNVELPWNVVIRDALNDDTHVLTFDNVINTKKVEMNVAELFRLTIEGGFEIA